MRRGFTLIELLVVIGILAAMMGVAVVSFSAGRGAFGLKAAARDVFAAIRQARSIALVTQKPCVITYAVDEVQGELCGRIEIAGAELMKDSGGKVAYTLAGESLVIGGDESAADAPEGGAAGGHSAAEVLFPKISEEVMQGVCLKVVSGEEALAESEGQEEMRKARVSIFSNVDYLLGKYKEARAAEKETEIEAESETAAESTTAKTAAEEKQEPVSFVWQVNGRCEPHRIYVYSAGSNPQDGLLITVDRFGAVKILSPGEEED